MAWSFTLKTAHSWGLKGDEDEAEASPARQDDEGDRSVCMHAWEETEKTGGEEEQEKKDESSHLPRLNEIHTLIDRE